MCLFVCLFEKIDLRGRGGSKSKKCISINFDSFVYASLPTPHTKNKIVDLVCTRAEGIKYRIFQRWNPLFVITSKSYLYMHARCRVITLWTRKADSQIQESYHYSRKSSSFTNYLQTLDFNSTHPKVAAAQSHSQTNKLIYSACEGMCVQTEMPVCT